MFRTPLSTARRSLLVLAPAALLAACSNESALAPEPIDPGMVLLATHNGATVPVHTVTISPSSATLRPGRTAQLAASLKDSLGRTLIGSVSWSSANTQVARVSSTGLVTGYILGTARITATSEGKSASVTITVAGPASAECGTMQSGWIFCDDFEVSRRASYFEYDSAAGNFMRTAVGVAGSQGMRARFNAGQVSAGSLKLAFGRTPQARMKPVDAGTAKYRDIYWRLYVRYEPSWTGGGGDKLARAQTLASSNWAQASIGAVWSGRDATRDYLILDPHSGVNTSGTLVATKYNDFNNIRWLGALRNATPLFNSAHVGKWHCVEVRTRLNDAGYSNGRFEIWVNGALEASKTNLNWVGSYSDYGLNTVFVENFWNAGSPKAQERYFDNLVVSTQRIGC